MVGFVGGIRVDASVSDITWPKGSLSSLEGEETEDGRLEVPFVGDETELFAALGVVVEIEGCRKPWLGLAGDSLTPGEAKRERVLRNADFLFGGMAIDERAAGSLGFFTWGWASRSFSSSSTSSNAVRMSVRLWVGANKQGYSSKHMDPTSPARTNF
jgi:hypothetical protein